MPFVPRPPGTSNAGVAVCVCRQLGLRAIELDRPPPFCLVWYPHLLRTTTRMCVPVTVEIKRGDGGYTEN